MLPPEIPVLVVGAGPSGAMAALLLERLGVETAIVERREGPQRAPAAHVVNARTFEICRAAGVNMQSLDDAAMDPADAGFAYFVTKLGGMTIGRLPFERQGDDQLAFTPTPLRNLSQNHFEPILVEALESSGRPPQWRMQWESAEQSDDRVVSRVRDLETDRVHTIESRFLIAADGAGSRVRRQLGIEVLGPERLQSFVMVHFHAKLRGIAEVPPGVLFFLCDPATGGGVFVIHDLDREGTFMHPFDPDQESLESYDAARCAELVRAGLEDPGLPLSVETVSTWTMTAQVAERYREGRIFLVGDSAHRFPPTGGLGLNSGVQDAHNLAWKLAAVHQGWGPESLLATYETERLPVAQTNADQSLRNALRLLEVPQALGVADPARTSSATLKGLLADPAAQARVSEAVANQAEHFDMPGLQLGFRYEHGALVPELDATPLPPLDPRTLTPSGRPGSRLPHTWLGVPAERVSLLDRVPLDRFLLVAGPAGGAWIEALAALGGARITGLTLSPRELPDPTHWLAQAGIETDGALLVRPDQHVAWRARSAVRDPADALTRALEASLAG